jgi:predicted outer membrane repeat protein
VTLDGGAQNFRLILMQSGSNLALRDLTLANGRAPGDSGGAIFNDFGTLTLTRCTLFGNSAEYGGAIYTFTAGITGSITSSITLTHCTLSGNTATVQGGAIYNENGRTTLIHCTVSGNTAPAGAGSGVASWGDSDTETVVQNSIIAGNVNSDVNLVGSTAPNSFKSQGYNLIGSGNATNFNQTGDLINVAPLLAPLGSYGGGTQTRPPLANSPAIDAASAVAGLPTDQRGLPRASGPAPDIGAVELQEIRVNTLADENNGIGNGSSVSLREALTSTAPGVAEVVRFAPAVFNGTPVGKNTIPLGSEIVVAKSVLVDAGDIPAGVTLDGGAQNFRLIYVDGASGGSNLALRGLTLANGRAPGDFGGAIFNYFGTLTLTRCTLFGNSADSGGAIFSRTASITAPITSSTSLTHCTLSGNTATAFFDGAGGAIWNGNGRTTLLHCTVSGNTAPMGAGSGVASLATANTETLVQNSVIAGNVNSDVDFVFNATNSFTSQGYNRIGSGNATGDFNQPGDLINVAPLLAPLGDYGGPTRTMLPLPGSPAIDAALTSTATADQRGIPRPQGAARDIGAVETFTLSAPAFLDNDSDGMDDRLEPLYGFTVGVADGALDTDGDGSSNAAELGNKTSPRDSTSLLRIVAFTPAGFALDGDPLFDVTWTSFPGLTYTLQAKADLNFAVAPRDAPDVTATAFTHTLRIELDKNNPKDFIRVRRNVIP